MLYLLHQNAKWYSSVLCSCVAAFAHQHVLGCLGSIATLTMGVASKLIGVKGGQAGDVEMVADLRMNSSMPPIPAEKQTTLKSAAFKRPVKQDFKPQDSNNVP